MDPSHICLHCYSHHHLFSKHSSIQQFHTNSGLHLQKVIKSHCTHHPPHLPRQLSGLSSHKCGKHFATSNSHGSIIFTWKQNLSAINTGHTSKYFYFFYFLQITLFSKSSTQNKTQK